MVFIGIKLKFNYIALIEQYQLANNTRKMSITRMKKDVLVVMLMVIIGYVFIAFMYSSVMMLTFAILYTDFLVYTQPGRKMKNINNVSAGRLYDPYYTISKALVETCRKYTVRRFLERLLYFPFASLYTYYMDYGSSVVFLSGYLQLRLAIQLIDFYMEHKEYEFQEEYNKYVDKLIDKYKLGSMYG